MMDEPKDSGSTATSNETATGKAAEDAAANASADDTSPVASHLGHEAAIDMNRRKQAFIPISDQDGATVEFNGPEDVRQPKQGLVAYVASPGLGESSLNDQSSSAAEAAEINEEGILGNSNLNHSVAVSEQDIYSPPPSSSSSESSENSYTSFERLIDEPPGKTNISRYDSNSENTGDEKYQKNIDKGKGKEVAPRVPEPEPMPPVEGQQSQTLNNVPWVQDPERPPQKFPIRFTDCVGRNFVWPWKKAQTWKGAKRLVESAFLYVDVLGPHVFAGHYDLTIQGMWSDPKTAAINPTLASYPPATTPSSNTVPSDYHINGFGDATSASSSSIQPGLPASSTNIPPHLLPKLPGRGAIILPELWEDVVEPGMLILMRMWPLAPGPPTHSHPPHMPVVPMPPPTYFQGVGGVGRGRGTGRGMTTSAAGRGSTQPPPLPPGWQQPPQRRGTPLVVIPYRPPKGKTRKRQDGL